MAEAVVSVVLETIGFLIEKVGFLKGVSCQVEQLQTELREMQSLLKDADRKQHNSDAIRNWIKEIRRLAYKAEDVLEEYAVKASDENKRSLLSSANEIWTSYNFGSEIETIKSQITILTGKMNQAGIQHLITRDQEETSDENKRRFIRKTYAHEELEHFVGMEEDIKNLVSLLVSDKKNSHQVIGVWGMGGSGKTTVAKKVYKHDDVKRSFKSFAWVCITQKCQIQSVMQDIFLQLLPERKNDTAGIDELVEKIYNVQMEKKCLIVVDDIWKLDDWKCLRKCLPSVGSHSKVLLTTRNRKVAEIGCPIQLKGFTEDEAWKLLRMKAFAEIDLEEPRNDSEYEKLGREMIRKCDRLPLAVAVVGGILSGKNSLDEWKLASEDVNSYIGRDEGTGVAGEVEKVLALSYDELPYHLKPCFLSLGFLQEDDCQFLERIYETWMAEGLIQSKHFGRGETIRDVARRYLVELHFRSMVQLDVLWNVSLHDSILDMCRSKAKEEEFLKVVGKHNINSEKAYRLVMYEHDLDVLKAVEIITPLRSMQVIFKGDNFPNLPEKILNLPRFKSLRTLIVYHCDLRGKCLHGIEDIIHLRLLGLIECKWERFSLEWVDKLCFLQTLDLSDTEILSLPPVDTFCNMRQLRNLYLPRFLHDVRIEGKLRVGVEEKLRLMNLSQLENLLDFDSNFYDLKDIRLQKLRSLQGSTTDEESLVQITDYICGNNNLRWIDITINDCNLDGQQGSDALRKLLKIPNVTFNLSIISCKLLKLPRLETVDFSNELVRFILKHTYIVEDIMQALDKFPNLRIIWLDETQFGGEEMICGAGSFPLLEQLGFFDVEGEFELRIDEAAMPNLSIMKIVRCSGINAMLPERLKLFAQFVI